MIINGTEYVLSTSSDDGAYEEITIDTSSVKTLEIATKSGACRVCIDEIIFVIG